MVLRHPLTPRMQKCGGTTLHRPGVDSCGAWAGHRFHVDAARRRQLRCRLETDLPGVARTGGQDRSLPARGAAAEARFNIE
ncbi:MAG: hypothetical protein IT449_11355 [Phycisphaerales bacterium]|nr:hypothetical protein [Phycisphaerales bacterium]